MKAQLAQTVAQFTEADRLRKHLLFATKQLQVAKSAQRQASAGESNYSTTPLADLDLSRIESIEPVYVDRLHDSGIFTIADLARHSPEQVAEFVGLPNWEASTQWVAEANDILAASADRDT
jgi:predicted flap endonuclease-1-like 5' DNA nuclease